MFDVHLLCEVPEQLEVVCAQAVLGGQRLEHFLHLVHVLPLVQVRSQQNLHHALLHQPAHRVLHNASIHFNSVMNARK